MTYGLPYQGSKSKIAADIVALLPAAHTFYDVFAGGGAITHAAILSGKYQRVVANDISDSLRLFEDAALGKYRNENRWISRSQFFELKESDPYVRLCWSFGNNSKEYMYNIEREHHKECLHNAVYFGDCAVLKRILNEINPDQEMVFRSLTPQERYDTIRRLIRRYGRQDDPLMNEYNKLEEFSRLNRVNSLTRLERFVADGKLQCLRGDYRDIVISDDAVIYCDPPYFSTAKYLTDFDHLQFYEWCKRQRVPVYISEYSMPDDFRCLWAVSKESLFSQKGCSKKVVERIFSPKTQVEKRQFTLFDIV